MCDIFVISQEGSGWYSWLNCMLINFSFVQVDTFFFDGICRTCQNTQRSLQYFFGISKKKLGMKMLLCMQVNISDFISWYYPFWLVWLGMFKVPKITSLQYHRDDILDYLHFWYVQRPSGHGNNLLWHVNQRLSQTIIFIWKMKIGTGVQ